MATMTNGGDQWVLPSFRSMILRRSTTKIGDGDDGGASAQTPPTSLFPSAVPWNVEKQLRWTTCAFIEDLAHLVELPDAPSILAQLYVQRFYVLHSFESHDRFLVATAALFLAGKSEEFPIKVRLLTECAMFLLRCPPRDSKHGRSKRDGAARKRKSASGRTVAMSASLGNDPEAANAKHLDCLHALLEIIDVGEIETTAARVLLLERVLLQTLSFDLSIPQPFAYVSRSMEPLFQLEAMHPSINYENVRAIAFLFLNDAVKSGLVLAFDSVTLAVGAVYLSCLYRNHVSPNVATHANEPWWSIWGLSPQALEDVARGLLWMYEEKDGVVRAGVSTGLKELWDRYRPENNRPDMEYIRMLDADLTGPHPLAPH